MSDIAILLRDEGWDLPTYAIGEYECLCPKCSHLRKPQHQKSKCAKVWIESDDFATYSCFNCGIHGFIKPENVPTHVNKNYTKPVVKPEKNINEAAEFLNVRQISKKTADYLGWYVKDGMLAMPYYKNGEIVNVKYRGLKEKKFIQEKNPEPVLYNYDNAFDSLKAYNQTLIIVEGEVDAATFVEAGYKNCVSLPSGSDAQIRDKTYTGSKFDFIKCSAPLLESAKTIILALDADAPGQAMTQSLINMLPKEKLFLVDWSVYSVPGKDANDFWRKDKNIIQDAINNVKPVESSQITKAIDDPQRLERYLIDGLKGGYKTGFENMDSFVTFMPGDFVSITGFPSSGKSTWMMNLMLNMAKIYDLKCLYCAFENPKDQVVSKFLQFLTEAPTYNATPDVIAVCRTYYQWINDHFYLIDDGAENLNIDKLLNGIKNIVIQKGVDMVVIDPFNKLEFSRTKDQSGDIGVVLNKLISFAHRHKVLMFLVAHPTKPNSDSRKIGAQNIPSGFDIAGSANFQNMSDAVISVHRPQNEFGNKANVSRVTVSKWRFGERGHEGSAFFDYNVQKAKYIPTTKTVYDLDSQSLKDCK